MKKYTLKI